MSPAKKNVKVPVKGYPVQTVKFRVFHMKCGVEVAVKEADTFGFYHKYSGDIERSRAFYTQGEMDRFLNKSVVPVKTPDRYRELITGVDRRNAWAIRSKPRHYLPYHCLYGYYFLHPKSELAIMFIMFHQDMVGPTHIVCPREIATAVRQYYGHYLEGPIKLEDPSIAETFISARPYRIKNTYKACTLTQQLAPGRSHYALAVSYMIPWQMLGNRAEEIGWVKNRGLVLMQDLKRTLQSHQFCDFFRDSSNSTLLSPIGSGTYDLFLSSALVKLPTAVAHPGFVVDWCDAIDALNMVGRKMLPTYKYVRPTPFEAVDGCNDVNLAMQNLTVHDSPQNPQDVTPPSNQIADRHKLRMPILWFAFLFKDGSGPYIFTDKDAAKNFRMANLSSIQGEHRFTSDATYRSWMSSFHE